MKLLLLCCSAGAFAFGVLATRVHAAEGALPPAFEGLELVQEIDVTAPTAEADAFREFPAGASQVASALGEPVRVLPNDRGGPKFFGYRVGRGLGLKAGEAYVLELVYPEDAPRAMFVVNNGCETARGFHTGRTLGDARQALYVNHNPESLEVPLSGRFERWQMLFHLHERFPEQRRPRELEHPRAGRPEDGFWVYVGQFAPGQDPLSQGAAVARIRLFRAPSPERYSLSLRPPPAGLPRRHLFWREEMADGVVDPREAERRGVTDCGEWFEHKARLARFLGVDTYAKDLLEFGANQGWDSAKYGGDDWVYQNREPQRWERIVEIAAKHGLNVLPYYEYSGSKGRSGLGNQKRALPLTRDDYTHVKWTESARADLTDPDTFEDFRRMLEITIVDQKARARFLGAWLRPRPSQLAISFGDGALARFTAEKSKAASVTREGLRADQALHAEYLAWWKDKRKDFLNRVRDYLRAHLGEEAFVLYTADTTEPGQVVQNWNQPGLIAEDPAPWERLGITTVPPAHALARRWQYHAMTSPMDTWGGWEWQHAVPPQDPRNYRDNSGVFPTFSFNRAYTVADAAALEEFTTPSGLAILRYHGLNEHMFRVEGEKQPDDPLGYFVVDMERAGPHSMLAEARAMAHGDPRMIGYLSGNSFNRGFPNYVRAFNAAFLALPALPSRRLADASPDPEVVVREIDAGAHGRYFAIVNTSYFPKSALSIRLPAGGLLRNAATGEHLPQVDGATTLSLYSGQLLAVHRAGVQDAKEALFTQF